MKPTSFTCFVCLQTKSFEESVEVKIRRITGYVCDTCFDTPKYIMFKQRFEIEQDRRIKEKTKLCK